MSHPPSLTGTVANLPLVSPIAHWLADTVFMFDSAINRGASHCLAAIVVATVMAAGATWGTQFVLGQIPLLFVKKHCIPAAEWVIYSGQTWLVFQALASVKSNRPVNNPPPPTLPETPKK